MDFKCVDSLIENPKEIFDKVTDILIKLIDNVLKYPLEPKYKKIRLENATISKYVLPSVGGMECLFEMGFIEGDDSLILPNTVSSELLKVFRQKIVNIKKQTLTPGSASPSSASSAATTTTSTNNNKISQAESKTKSCSVQPEVPAAIGKERYHSRTSEEFLQSLEVLSISVCQYENRSLQVKALRYVPVSKIESEKIKQLRSIQKSALKSGSPDFCESSVGEIIFLKELMKWFKTEFFKWVDSPMCPSCNLETEFIELSSDPRDLMYTNRVEVYICHTCNHKVLFPRYNNASLLLDSRCGRCGEWAQCFTLFCRALGWEARYISDNTDHAWTEVYSNFQKRWIHCDSCECSVDTPLMYEKGWKKKLDYVIGFSFDGVQDVTWRYSGDHKALLSRRNMVSEQALVAQILKLNEDRRSNLSDIRKKYLLKRQVIELTDFLIPAKEKQGETLGGRTSGSLAWRLARGEISLPSTSALHIWEPNPDEISSKKIVLKYCSSRDEYFNEKNEKLLSGWQNGAFELNNIFRKEELDWKNVYLCRTEGTSSGSIVWSFNTQSSGLVVESITIECSFHTFETGLVKLILCGEENCVVVPPGKLEYGTDCFKGCEHIKLKAELSGGNGDVAWQHAQLFRQPLVPSDEFPYSLSITITLCKL